MSTEPDTTPAAAGKTPARRRGRKIAAGVLLIGLLAGTGGSFATWKVDLGADQGAVTAGTMDLTAAPGTWATSDGTPIPDIEAYKMTPGTTITYTQDLDANLVADGIRARIASEHQVTSDGAASQDITVSPTLLYDPSTGSALGSDEVTTSRTVRAVTRFTLAPSAAMTSTTGVYDLASFAYRLDQTPKPEIQSAILPAHPTHPNIRITGTSPWTLNLPMNAAQNSGFQWKLELIPMDGQGPVTPREQIVQSTRDAVFTIPAEGNRSYLLRGHQVRVKTASLPELKGPVFNQVVTIGADRKVTVK